MKGVIIAGTGSGVGKTSITTGLLSKMSKFMKVQAFKVGPDFIDPMYHSLATGRPARNLDTFMISENKIRNLVGYASNDSDICVVEGVRGLYEGLSGTNDNSSTAEIAKILGFPVILIVNARSLTRSAAAIVNGFKSFDPDVNIAGIIFNEVSNQQHEKKLREATEKYTDANVIGVVRHDGNHIIGERHLGLKTINEKGKDDIKPLESLVDDIDIDRVMDIAESSYAPDIEYVCPYAVHNSNLKVAIPMDDAYCFYYRENIECMISAGMNIKTFSPLAGDSLPDADFYYLGGGYPELFGKELSNNLDFLEGLKNASIEKKKILGECGGLMTMCSSIQNKDGIFPMSGIFNAKSIMSTRHGPNYIIAHTTANNTMFDHTVIRGHEFHYSEIVTNSEYAFGYDMKRGVGIDGKNDGLIFNNSMGSYIHQHALSMDDWLGKIVETN